jgi:hypothetical protein
MTHEAERGTTKPAPRPLRLAGFGLGNETWSKGGKCPEEKQNKTNGLPETEGKDEHEGSPKEWYLNPWIGAWLQQRLHFCGTLALVAYQVWLVPSTVLFSVTLQSRQEVRDAHMFSLEPTRLRQIGTERD